MQGFFRKWYVPSNATLTIAGDFQPEQAKALVEKWSGSFPKLPQPAHPQVGAPQMTQTVRRELDDPFARLYRIHYAWHSPPRLGGGDIELEALADVLGSSGWGRLYKALVLEDKSAQSVAAYQSGSGHSGTFHVIVDLKPGHDPVKAELTVRRELERLLREPISDAELKRVVVGTESAFVWGLEDVMGRVERLQYFNHYARDPGYANTYLQRLRAVTPARIREVANQWWSSRTPRSSPSRPRRRRPRQGGPVLGDRSEGTCSRGQARRDRYEETCSGGQLGRRGRQAGRGGQARAQAEQASSRGQTGRPRRRREGGLT